MIYKNPKTWFPERNPKDLSEETFEIIPNRLLIGITRRRCAVVPYPFVKNALDIIVKQWDIDAADLKQFKIARQIMINSVINN